jgi:anti-sigma B factor antagonist
VAADRPVKTEEGLLFHVDSARAADHVTLRLVGELDVDTVHQLHAAFEQAEEAGVTTVVADVSALAFIDSTGLHELVVARKRRQARGGEIILQSPTDNILRVLRVVGLDQVFAIR